MNEETKIVVPEVLRASQAPQVPQAPASAITEIATGSDDIIQIAETIEEKTKALKKIMIAAISMTTPNDWVIIGDKPYLQESGCNTLGSLLGISFEICPGFPTVETDKDGYKTFKYRIRAFNKRSYVEAEGQRCMREDFFSKKKDGIKLPIEIKERDVMIAALTNAKANAIKSIVPGLKNVELSTLENAGIDCKSIKGFSFQKGSNGGGKTESQNATYECERCHAQVSGKVAAYSRAKFSGMVLCVDCQGKARVGGKTVEPYDPNLDDGNE